MRLSPSVPLSGAFLRGAIPGARSRGGDSIARLWHNARFDLPENTVVKIQEIWADMSRKAATIDPLGKTLIFCLDDERLLIDGTGERNDVSIVTGQDAEAECTVTMSMDTWGKLQRNELKPFIAVASRKIKVKGDLSIAAKLKQLT